MKGAPGTPTHITTADRARVLGERIVDPQRRHPVVVVTRDESDRSSFDAEEIAARLRIYADVWVVDARRTWDLNERLGSAKIFGDAAAVYPPTGGGRLSHRMFTPATGATDSAVVAAAREASPGRVGGRAVARGASRVAPIRPTPGLHLADTAAHVEALADHLLDPDRDRPVAVVTIPTNRVEAWISPQDIVEASGPAAEVHVLATGPRTFQLTDRLTQLAGVYGGAGRVYDVGQRWLEDPYLSPLRFAYDQGEGRRATADLVDDLIGALARSGHLTTETAATTAPVTGTVAGLVPPSRAMVQLDGGGLATVWAERVVTGVDVGSLVVPGMVVNGPLDSATGRIDITAMLRSAEAAVAELVPRSVIHALVTSVTMNSVTLTPFPGIVAHLSADAITGNSLDDLTELLSPDEVVAARYLYAASETSWSLTMLDIDDDEPVTLVPLIHGGPPWLTVAEEPEPEPSGVRERTHESVDEQEEQERLRTELHAAEARLAEVSSRSKDADDLARRSAELETQLRARELEIDDLQRAVRDGRLEVSRLQRRVEHERAAKRRAVQRSNKRQTAPEREVLGFSDPVEQLRWDIHRTWVETTRPEDKDEWPLTDTYLVGMEFARSVDELEGVSRERVLLVLVRLLSGRGVRDDHPLRSSQAGGAPAVTRVVDGAEWTCRRAPLQQSSPSARRLSYWRHPSGQIELSRVVLHDDLAP